jgi:hypothetical protein
LAGAYRTAYVWEEVWDRDSWLEILARFVHLEVKDEVKNGRRVRKEALVYTARRRPVSWQRGYMGYVGHIAKGEGHYECSF